MEIAPATGRQGREILGHPRGLAYIVFTETWERFSFYGTQALLILYTTQHLFLPGPREQVAGLAAFRSALEAVFGQLSLQAFASQTFGLYVGLIYLSPVIGGWAGDRFFGRFPSVMAGAASMAAGHAMLAFEVMFLPGLLALIVGSGLLKGNLAAQVGELYAAGDPRRDSGYTAYFTGINIGAFAAPLVCGTLGEIAGWRYGFAAAAVAMVVGMIIYAKGRAFLQTDDPRRERKAEAVLEQSDRRRMTAIVLLLLTSSLFWTVQAQVWNVYPLWLRDDVDRTVGGFEVPVTWFQSLDAMTVLMLAPVVMALWKWQAGRAQEPADMTKIAIGCGIFAAASLLLAGVTSIAGSSKAGIAGPVLFHLLIGGGYLYCAPVTLALVSRLSPQRFASMFAGAFYVGIFIGGLFSGWLARFYEPLGPGMFWLMHMMLGLIGSVIILVLRALFVDCFHRAAAPPAVKEA